MTKGGPDRLSAILRAAQIMKELCIEHPSHIDVGAIALARGVLIKEESMKGADGRLAALGEHGLITVREDIAEPGKKRFVAAHELGHYELHRKLRPAITCREGAFFEWSSKNTIEVEANYFAAELLMPTELFRERTEKRDLSIEILKFLCDEFTISLTAAAIRYVTIRPEYALVCSNSEGISWFVIDPDHFQYYVNTKGRVHEDSLAYDYFKGLDLPNGFLPVEQQAWIDSRYRIRGQLKELAVPLGRYAQVLSFLYIEEPWD